MSIFFRCLKWWGSALALVFLMAAMTTNVSASGAISQSYSTSSDAISKGALLSTTTGESTTVELANRTVNISKLVGIAAEDALIEFSDGSQTNTQVVTNGLTQALVCDINGKVKAGDKITASPIGGIGMKATTATEVVGTAQADLATVTTVKQAVAALDGSQKTMEVGLLPVAVSVGYYTPVSGPQNNLSSFVPQVIQSVADNVAGKSVSPGRVLLAGAVLMACFIITGIMLYTSIRNSMISIGRNPLAEKMVRKGVREIIFAAVAVMVLTAGIIYAIVSL